MPPRRTGLCAAALSLCAACAPPDADRLTVASQQTGFTCALDVLSPPGTTAEEALPSVYVLEGHYHFRDLSRHVSRAWEADALAPFRLVGVGYDDLDGRVVADLMTISERRIDELSFPEDPDMGGGEGDRFHAALTTELLPAVDAAYAPDAADRTLMGHSLGGHFVLLDPLRFAPHDRAFSTIVAASPSVWWAEGSLLADEADRAEAGGGLPLHLLIGTGTLEGTHMNAPKDALVQRLRSRDHAGLQLTQIDPTAGHMQAAADIFEDALAEVHP